MADQFEAPKFRASAAILKSRFVKLSGNFKVAQGATSTDKVFGIASEAARNEASSTYAAATNDTLQVYAPGAFCLLQVATAVAYGQYLRSDTSGKGRPITDISTPQGVGARALTSGSNGEYIHVFVSTFTTGATPL